MAAGTTSFRIRHLSIAVVLAFAGCSSQAEQVSVKTSLVATTAEADVMSITVTRPDGTEVTMPELRPYVWCGDYSEGFIEVPQQAVHLALWPRLDPSYEGDPTGWFLRAVIDDIEPGQPLELPSKGLDFGDIPNGSVAVGVDIFAVVDLNDFSSVDPASRGTVVFETTPCSEGSENVSVEVDAVVAAEGGDGTSIAIKGRFSGGFNQPPSRDYYGQN